MSVTQGKTLTVKNTGNLIFEYVKLDAEGLGTKFMYRLVEPVQTAWFEGYISIVASLVDTVDGRTVTFEDKVARVVRERWDDMVGPLASLFKPIETITAFECDIVRKDA